LVVGLWGVYNVAPGLDDVVDGESEGRIDL
jgi:hypothetical protein